jgi:hypothetical protein
MLAVHGDWVKKETLAVGLEATLADEVAAAGAAAPAVSGSYQESLKVNGLSVTVEVWKA